MFRTRPTRPRSKSLRFPLSLGPATVLALALIAPSAHAATFTVTDTTDNGGTGGCAPDTVASPCSLRQAIESANNNGGADVIVFDSTTFATNQTITANDYFNLTDDLTITGLASKVTLLKGTGGGPFPINGLLTVNTITVSLSNLVLDGFEIV